jgi:hypothetical protein
MLKTTWHSGAVAIFAHWVGTAGSYSYPESPTLCYDLGHVSLPLLTPKVQEPLYPVIPNESLREVLGERRCSKKNVSASIGDGKA